MKVENTTGIVRNAAVNESEEPEKNVSKNNLIFQP